MKLADAPRATVRLAGDVVSVTAVGCVVPAVPDRPQYTVPLPVEALVGCGCASPRSRIVTPPRAATHPAAGAG